MGRAAIRFNTRATSITATTAQGMPVLSFPNGESLTLQGISPQMQVTNSFERGWGFPMPDVYISGTAATILSGAGYLQMGDGDTVDNNDAISARLPQAQ